ncbi:MAG: 1-acyl-sn-glycerol-3-phosphate acyltransferase [Bacteroidetes bacterium]|nr:1-acyl-sn-glycerol-3-phosphate acyltransferase [Bacteroidota bacterium]
MKILKSAFGFAWAMWGALWFMITMMILTPIYSLILFFGGKEMAMPCIWFNFRYLGRFLLFMFCVRLKVYGKENIDPKKTFVIVANHAAQLDIIAGAASTPQPAKFLAKSELLKVPFFGYMTKMLAIVVERGKKESREKSFRYMVVTLRKGESIFIYPEGTRNRTTQPLKEFKDGAFRVAIMAQMPIAVQTLTNTKKLNDPNGIQLFPGTVKVYWSKPIETKGMTIEDLPALREKVRQEMLQHLV